MPDHSFESGFLCGCGTYIGDASVHLQVTRDWSNKGVFINAEVEEWIGLENEHLDRIKRTVTYKPGLVANNNYTSHLLNIAHNKRGNIQSYRVRGQRLPPESYGEMYEAVEDTLQSFEKNLFRTYLAKHQHCIKRFTGLFKSLGQDFPEICPYAYAYVFW